MTTFKRMLDHVLEPGRPTASVVLSELGPGRSMVSGAHLSLKLVLSGEELYRVDGELVRLTPGQILFLEAGADCEATVANHAIGCCIRFFDPPATADRELAHETQSRFFLHSASTSQLGRSLTSRARALAANPTQGPELAPIILSEAQALIGEAIVDRRRVLEKIGPARFDKRRTLFQQLDAARGYLHDNIGRAVTLEELAQFTRMSRFHLARLFNTAFGESPVAYHRRLRLERGAELLRDTDAPLSVIAERVGYADQTAFSHAFRRHFGHSPRARDGNHEKGAAPKDRP